MIFIWIFKPSSPSNRLKGYGPTILISIYSFCALSAIFSPALFLNYYLYAFAWTCSYLLSKFWSLSLFITKKSQTLLTLDYSEYYIIVLTFSHISFTSIFPLRTILGQVLWMKSVKGQACWSLLVLHHGMGELIDWGSLGYNSSIS